MGILTFSLKKIQIAHPWDKIIGQNVHPAASEGGKMSFVQLKSLAWGHHRPHDQTPVVSHPWGLTLLGALIKVNKVLFALKLFPRGYVNERQFFPPEVIHLKRHKAIVGSLSHRHSPIQAPRSDRNIASNQEFLKYPCCLMPLIILPVKSLRTSLSIFVEVGTTSYER